MKQTKELSEILGTISGDGWIESTEKGLYIVGNIKDDKEYFDKHLGPLFSKTLIEVKPKIYPYWSVYGIHTYKQEIIRDVIKLGIKKGKKVDSVKVPKWIFSSREFMVFFLKGLFDTDGNFGCKKCYGRYDNEFNKKYHTQPIVRIDSISKQLLVDVFEIMKRLDLHPEKIKMRKGGLKCGKWCMDSYFIKLNKRDEIKTWFETLKLSSNPKHIDKYLIWKKFGFYPPKINSIERKEILKGKINPYFYYDLRETGFEPA